MTNKLLSIFVIAVMLVSAACTRQPKACFEFSDTTLKVNDTVTLVNCSTDYTDVKWLFPLGGTSSVNNPRVKMSSAGVYEVQLIVGNDDFKETASTSRSVVVEP
ncbi:MAG: hypothetical protein RL660_2189 [Bacteroidota bacterium]|jgi:PKD repeat protein